MIRLLKRERLPRAILFERQLDWTRRPFGRDGDFYPQFIAALEGERALRVLGDVEVDRLIEAQVFAGNLAPGGDPLADRILVAFGNAYRHEAVVLDG